MRTLRGVKTLFITAVTCTTLATGLVGCSNGKKGGGSAPQQTPPPADLPPPADPVTPPPAPPAPGPRLVVMGDSLNEGVFADRAFGEPLNFSDLANFVSKVVAGTQAPKEFTKLYQAPQMNAYTGTAILNNLAKTDGFTKSAHIHECVKGGAGTDYIATCVAPFTNKDPDLKFQAEAVTHVYVALGSNDYCKTQTPTQSEVIQRLSLVAETFPKATIFVSGPAPVYKVSDFADEPLISNTFFTALQCGTVQQRYCPALAEEGKDQWEAFHGNHKGAVEEFAKTVSADVYYSDLSTSADKLVEKSMLAIDCFHLSSAGHTELAKTLREQRQLLPKE